MSISGVIAAGFTLYFTGGNLQAAAAAYAIGSGVESLVLSPTNKVNGPKASDYAIQISSYGAVLPYQEGTCRYPGNIIWSTPKIPTEHTTSSGGKGGSKTETTTETLSVSFAVAFASFEEGREAFAFRRHWFDKKLLIDFGQAADAAAIIASGFLASSIRFYPGSETQDPDPLIESYDGVGNTSAFLGTCYIVFENLQLQEFGNRIPNIEVEIIAEGADATTHRNIAAVSVDDLGDGAVRGRSWASERVQYVFRPSSSGAYDSIAVFKTTDGAEQVPIGIFGLPTAFGATSWGEAFPVKTRDRFLVEHVEYYTDPISGDGYQSLRIIDPLGIDEEGTRASATVALLTGVDIVSATCHMGDVSRMTAFDQDSGVVAFTIRDGSTNYYAQRVCMWFGGGDYVFRVGAGSTVCCAIALAAGKLFAMIFDGTKMQLHVVDQETATLLDVFDGPAYLPDFFATDVLESIRTDGATTWAWAPDGLLGTGHVWKWLADGTVVPLSDLVEGEDDALTQIDLLGGPGAYIDDTHIISYGAAPMNAGPDPIFRVQLVHWKAPAPTGVPLGDIVERLCAQRNITVDVTELAGIDVAGFLIARQMSTADALTFLAGAYYFDLIAPGDGTLYAKKRGGAPDGTVLISDLAAHDFGAEVPDAFPDNRTKEQDLPQYYSINFTDPLADYQTGNVPAQRQNTQAAQRITLDVTALVMEAEEAARIVDIAKTVSQVERMKGTCSADYRMKKYLPGDVVNFVAPDITYRRRLTKITDHQGLLQIEHVADDAYAYQSVATGTGAGQAATVVTPGGSVHLELMDIPIMRDEDDNTGFYARISPPTATWRGGSLYRTDGGGLLFEGSVSVANPVGVTLNEIADYVGPKVFDEGSTVDVRIYGGLALSSGTRAKPIPALIGREIVFYRTATALGGGKYRITGFRRYMRGTEDAYGTHAAGERFVLLGVGGTLRVDHGASDFGKVHQYTAVAPGRSIDTGDTRSFVNNGRGLLPFTPVCLGYGEDGSGGLLFKWRRRTRLETVFGTEAPLGEETEEYRVDFSAVADFATVPMSFFTPIQSLALDASQRLLLPAPFYWRPVMIGSGVGSSPTPPPPGTPGILPGAPADTLPTISLDIDPTGAADGAAIVDSSGSPATVFNSGCRIDGGRIIFSDLYTRLKVDGGTRFNLGSADFSLAFDVLVRSKITTPEEQAILFNYGPEAGVTAGQLKIFFSGDGSFLVYFIDYGSAYGDWVLKSPIGMNDGRPRKWRVARSSGVFYLVMDGVVVDSLTASVSQTPLTGIQLIIGGFKGSMGRITLKKP